MAKILSYIKNDGKNEKSIPWHSQARMSPPLV